MPWLAVLAEVLWLLIVVVVVMGPGLRLWTNRERFLDR